MALNPKIRHIPNPVYTIGIDQECVPIECEPLGALEGLEVLPLLDRDGLAEILEPSRGPTQLVRLAARLVDYVLELSNVRGRVIPTCSVLPCIANAINRAVLIIRDQDATIAQYQHSDRAAENILVLIQKPLDERRNSCFSTFIQYNADYVVTHSG